MVIAVSCSVIYVRHSCRKVSNAAASYPGGMGGMEILKNHLEIAVDMAGHGWTEASKGGGLPLS